MGYDILFVGLVCFLKHDREALMPDGREPRQKNVAKHFPYIIVEPKAVRELKGWESETDAAVVALAKKSIFRLPKCRLEITGATTPGRLDATQHDRFVPKLVDSDPSVIVDPANANAVVRMKIGSGKLEALRVPHTRPDDDDVAILTRLHVCHNDPIRIDVYEDGQKASCRTILLEPHSEIALANVELPRDDASKTGNHFTIYGELTESGTIRGPHRVAPRVPAIDGEHRIFKLGIPVQDSKTPCGSQGCCPPPP